MKSRSEKVLGLPVDIRRDLIARSEHAAQNAARSIDVLLGQITEMRSASVRTRLHDLLSPQVEGIPIRTDLAREWRMRLGVSAQGVLPAEYIEGAASVLNEHRINVGVELSLLRTLAESDPLLRAELDTIVAMEDAINVEEDAGMDFGLAVAGI